MPVSGHPPARCALGLSWPGGAAAWAQDGRLVATAGPSGEGGWPTGAVAAVLEAAEVAPGGVEQVAVADPGGRLPPALRRRALASHARAALGRAAAFVRQGVVGTGLPRAWDRSDRLTLHPPHRCLAAAAYYTAGQRVLLVGVHHEGRASAWLGTSGKIVRLAPPEPVALADLVARWQERTGAPAVARIGGPDATAPLHGPRALAAGAALLALADERQGAWVPPPWRADGA